MSDELIWADDLRKRLRSEYPHNPDIVRTLRNNDSALIGVLNEMFGWECSGLPKKVLELIEKLQAGEDVEEMLESLRQQAERAAPIEGLRQEAWAEVNNLLEGVPLLAHRPCGDFE